MIQYNTVNNNDKGSEIPTMPDMVELNYAGILGKYTKRFAT